VVMTMLSREPWRESGAGHRIAPVPGRAVGAAARLMFTRLGMPSSWSPCRPDQLAGIDALPCSGRVARSTCRSTAVVARLSDTWLPPWAGGCWRR
jgi:hypothetical protein